jgi:indole-3-glycerol phosphate synthase
LKSLAEDPGVAAGEVGHLGPPLIEQTVERVTQPLPPFLQNLNAVVPVADFGRDYTRRTRLRAHNKRHYRVGSAMYLTTILEAKRAAVQLMHPADDGLAARLPSARRPRDFGTALQKGGVSLIAEVKPKSPSHGTFERAAQPVRLALEYQTAGASAISVLADHEFFGGGPELVERVANDATVTCPILYKDFIVDPRQVLEARTCGADAVLLIARAVEVSILEQLVAYTHELGMEALVETFDLADIAAAVRAGARVIGINNRDLETFQVDLCRSIRLAAEIPSEVLKVSESGIRTRQDVLRLEDAGFDAILVGESLLVSPDPSRSIAELIEAA